MLNLLKKRLWTISIAFRILPLKQAERKKAMGGREAAHGLHFQFKYLEWRQADLPSIFLPAPPVHPLQLRNMFHLPYSIKKLCSS